MIESAENYRVINGHHLAGMPEERKRILVLRWFGLTEAEIAEHEGLSLSSVRRHLDGALASIFDGIEVKRGAWPAGLWICCHQTCCLASAIAYARGDAA